MRRDWVAYTLMSVVAVAAAWMSFSALTGLARMAHVWPPQLLPTAIDAYAVAATRLWLTSSGRTRRWAMANSFGAIAISVAGNSAYHGYTEAGITHLSWQLAAAVAAVAPLTLWLVVHMHSLLSTPAPPGPVRDTAAEEPTTRVPDPMLAGPARVAGKPAPRGKRHVNGAGLAAKMREHAAAELAAGRRPTGGQLARKFGVDDSQGRRIMREMAAASNGNGHAG